MDCLGLVVLCAARVATGQTSGRTGTGGKRSLGSISDPKAVEALSDRLDDDAPNVREWSARALGQIGDPTEYAVDSLIESMSDENSEVKEIE